MKRNLLFAGQSAWSIPDRYDYDEHGAIEFSEESVSLGRGRPGTGIRYCGPPPASAYRLTWDARRTDGNDFFCGLTFPAGGSYLTLILGGWGGGLIGLSNLDGMSAVDNESASWHDFENDRWYALQLDVGDQSVLVQLDGKSVVDVSIADRRLDIWWEQEPMRPLGISSWNTAAQIRKLVLDETPR